MRPVICPYCDKKAKLMTGQELHGRDDLIKSNYYVCLPCQAWVCCHPYSIRAVGRLADAELRKIKHEAHNAYDHIWRLMIVRGKIPEGKARREGQKWLAKQLGMKSKECVIGQFDVDQCKQVIEVCSR